MSGLVVAVAFHLVAINTRKGKTRMHLAMRVKLPTVFLTEGGKTVAKKKLSLKEEVLSLRVFLHDRYIHYKDLYNNGCSDPSYCDGTNINLTCNHISYAKRKIEELCGDRYFMYPDEYYWPEPRRVADTYMAKTRKLACRGAVYEATPREFEIDW